MSVYCTLYTARCTLNTSFLNFVKLVMGLQGAMSLAGVWGVPNYSLPFRRGGGGWVVEWGPLWPPVEVGNGGFQTTSRTKEEPHANKISNKIYLPAMWR